MKKERIYLLVGRGLNACATLFASLMFLFGFSEYYTVAIKKDIEGYPFGSECAPDYYDTPELYASTVLISVVVFGILLIFQIINWKKSLISGFWVFGISLMVIFIEKFIFHLVI